jgi:23S rRNA (uracil1939-C5)-methyltransferase
LGYSIYSLKVDPEARRKRIIENTKEKILPGALLDVTIQRLVPRGLGIAFANGYTIFVPRAAAGDRSRVEVRHVKKRVAFADIVEVIEGGADRITPPCPYYGVCGGCDIQHINYAAQLSAKASFVADSLRRIGKFEVENVDIIPSNLEFGYRARARWQVDTTEAKVGYLRRDSHEIVDIEHCLILDDRLQNCLTSLRSDLRENAIHGGETQVDAAVGATGVSIHSYDLPLATQNIAVEVAGFKYAFSSPRFFQANVSLAGDLVRKAIEGLGGKTVFDLYSGVGLFSLPLSRVFDHVAAVEGDRVAAAYAEQNARSAEISNIQVVPQGVREFLSSYSGDPPDAVLIDPPRIGTEPGVIEKLSEIRPARISYVSCEPSILARDLRTLCDRGYSIASITALDMFPQTHHVETVAQLRIT